MNHRRMSASSGISSRFDLAGDFKEYHDRLCGSMGYDRGDRQAVPAFRPGAGRVVQGFGHPDDARAWMASRISTGVCSRRHRCSSGPSAD